MAFGDSGINTGIKGFFVADMAWTEGEIRGVNRMGNPETRPKQLVVDTGALFTTIDGHTARDLKVTPIGVIQNGTLAGFRTTGLFKGITIRFQAVKAGANVNVDYTGNFALMPIDPAPPGKEIVPPYSNPPFLGVTCFRDRGISVTVNYPANTVTLAQ